MLNKVVVRVKNAFIFFFIISCIKLFLNSIFAVIRVKDALTDGTYWFSVFYQPFLFNFPINRIQAIKQKYQRHNYFQIRFHVVPLFNFGYKKAIG